jgi:hypothetical protein
MASFIPRVTWQQLHLIHAGMRRVHSFGIRATAELGVDLAEQTDPATVLAVLDHYGCLTPECIAAAGGNLMMPRHLVMVP